MWLWPEYSRETKAPPVRILILDQQGVVRSSGRNTLSPVTIHCPECEAVVGENYITACEEKKPPAGSADARALHALREVLGQEGRPFSLEFGVRESDPPAWYQIMIFPLEGEQRGALLMQIDVTGRHQAQEELQHSHDEIRSLARQLIHAQEEERARIARDLHDDICQRLAVHALQINSLHRNKARNHSALTRRLAQLEKDAVEIGNAIRGFSRQLHPVMLEKFGLVAAIREFCTRTAAHHGLALDIKLGVETVDVTPALAISLYRIVQESFSNVARHAKASRVAVFLDQDSAGLSLMIEDNGVGFDPGDPAKGPGLGLVSMKERVQSFSGSLNIASSPGRGTRVSVEVPLNFTTPVHETSTHPCC